MQKATAADPYREPPPDAPVPEPDDRRDDHELDDRESSAAPPHLRPDFPCLQAPVPSLVLLKPYRAPVPRGDASSLRIPQSAGKEFPLEGDSPGGAGTLRCWTARLETRRTVRDQRPLRLGRVPRDS